LHRLLPSLRNERLKRGCSNEGRNLSVRLDCRHLRPAKAVARRSRYLRHLDAEDAAVALLWPENTGDEPQERGFAAAAGTVDKHTFACVYDQFIDAQDRHAWVVPKNDIL